MPAAGLGGGNEVVTEVLSLAVGKLGFERPCRRDPGNDQFVRFLSRGNLEPRRTKASEKGLVGYSAWRSWGATKGGPALDGRGDLPRIDGVMWIAKILREQGLWSKASECDLAIASRNEP